MASFLDRVFAPFEGTRNPYPVAVFRIVFFGALIVHFVPSMLHFGDAYSAGAMRSEEWSHWVYLHYWRWSSGWVHAAAVATVVALLFGLLGVLPRLSAAVVAVGLYGFASVNGLPVQTLALLTVWAILPLWVICGGGNQVLSVEALIRRKLGRAPAGPPRESRLLPALVLYQVLLGVFFAGIEKLLAGWPMSNEMAVVLNYPEGFMVRDWVASAGWLHGAFITGLLSWATVIIELGAPPALLFRRTRTPAFLAYQAFFLGIIAMLEVPPLFYFVYAGGALLALGDDQVDALLGRLRRLLRRSA